jgi:hypothetical protein
VIALGVGWLGMTAVTLVQALRGQPVTAPDPVTLGLAALVALAAIGVAISGRRAPLLVVRPATR